MTDSSRETLRPRMSAGRELTLALLPTATVLLVLALIEQAGHQRLLFASLASSAFLIYVDPSLRMNRVRTLVLAQLAAAVVGSLALWLIGPGYIAAAVAMGAFILLMVAGDFVHPPAVGTALTFAFRPATQAGLPLFGLAVVMVVLLVGLAQATTWLVRRLPRGA